MHLKKTCFDKWRRHTAIHSLMWPGLLRPTIHRPRWNKAMLFLLDFANIIQKLKIWFWITQNSNFFHKARAGYKFDSIISTLYFVNRMHSFIKPKYQITSRSSFLALNSFDQNVTQFFNMCQYVSYFCGVHRLSFRHIALLNNKTFFWMKSDKT